MSNTTLWYIREDLRPEPIDFNLQFCKELKSIGNTFTSKEECMLTCNKLRGFLELPLPSINQNSNTMNKINSNSIIEIPHIGKYSIEQLKILLMHLKTRYDTIKRYRAIVHEFRTEKFYNLLAEKQKDSNVPNLIVPPLHLGKRSIQNCTF